MLSREEFLSDNSAAAEEHSDHRRDNCRCLVRHAVVISAPLDNDKQVHVAKQGKQHDDLWHKLVPKVKPVPKVNRVVCLLEDAERHVGHAEDDRYLHLEGVSESDLLFGLVPDGVDAHWVDAVAVFVQELSCLEVVARTEEIQRNRHEIIVHESAEESEEAHQQKHVAKRQDHLGHLGRRLLNLI